MPLDYNELRTILSSVHNRFTYVSDISNFGMPEYWMAMSEIPQGNFEGDCEDFANAVRKEILNAGGEATLAVCGVNSRSLNHCVCISGDWVLDNIHKWPMKRSDLATYHFISMMDDEGVWREIL